MINRIYNSYMLIPDRPCTEISGFNPEAVAAAGTFPIFRIIIKFKKSIRRKQWPSLRIQVTGLGSGLLPFKLRVVRAIGQLIADNTRTRSINYSFIIDERIYYRKIICRPSLGLSPPVI